MGHKSLPVSGGDDQPVHLVRPQIVALPRSGLPGNIPTMWLYPRFGRPRFFGKGDASTCRPNPLSLASFDRVAAYSGATSG